MRLSELWESAHELFRSNSKCIFLLTFLLTVDPKTPQKAFKSKH
jgi:hypothetical protein